MLKFLFSLPLNILFLLSLNAIFEFFYIFIKNSLIFNFFRTLQIQTRSNITTQLNLNFMVVRSLWNYEKYIKALHIYNYKKVLKIIALRNTYLDHTLFKKDSKIMKLAIYTKKLILTFIRMMIKMHYKNSIKMTMLCFRRISKKLRFYINIPKAISFTQIITNFTLCIACIKLRVLALLAVYKKYLLHPSYFKNYNLYLSL